MDLENTNLNCQFASLRSIAEGPAEPPRESFLRRIKLTVRRNLSPDRERNFKRFTNDLINRYNQFSGKETRPTADLAALNSPDLQAGDRVRVRTEEEIQATLNNWGQLKGCTFMPEMVEYCNTEQRVHKVMQRFVDERDLKVKKVSGIILLEGVLCQGTADFGSCDRSCFFFWRQEWLEKIDG